MNTSFGTSIEIELSESIEAFVPSSINDLVGNRTDFQFDTSLDFDDNMASIDNAPMKRLREIQQNDTPITTTTHLTPSCNIPGLTFKTKNRSTK